MNENENRTLGTNDVLIPWGITEEFTTACLMYDCTTKFTFNPYHSVAFFFLF
jgi:hypothetical protein